MVRMSTSYTVGQVAHLAGVTVRTLHHYDEIGLLAPTDRTSSGYRRYGVSDLERLQVMAAAIEKELEAKQMGISLSPGEQFEVFGTDKVGGEWADEAEQRWGNTRWGDNSASKQSQRRTAKYTKQDWVKLKAEADEGLRAFADAMRAGTAAGSPAAMDLAEAHREYISRWFYDCDHDTHRGLAQMYVADPRFSKLYEDVAPGLARYVHDAIVADAAR